MGSIISFTGSVPLQYDRILGPFLFEPYALDLTERLKGKQYKNILELACGTGRLTNHLTPLISPEGQLIASDLNMEMLEVAKNAVLHPKVQWQVIDAQEIPFAANDFDLVVCQFGVMFFPDKLQAFSEVYRVLKGEGKFLFNVWDAMAHNPTAALVEEVLKEELKDKAPLFMSSVPYGYYEENEIRDVLKRAGFQQIQVDKVEKKSRFDNAEKLVKGFLEGTPLSSYLNEYDAMFREALFQKITHRFHKYFGNKHEAPLKGYVYEVSKI